MACSLIRRELGKKSILNKGFVLEGFPRSFLESVWLFGKKSKEINNQEIFQTIIKKQEKIVSKNYYKRKKLFFKIKNLKSTNPNITPAQILKIKKKKFYGSTPSESSKKFWSMFLNPESMAQMTKVIWESDEEESEEEDPVQNDEDVEEARKKLISMGDYFENREADVDALLETLEKLKASNEEELYELGKYR